MSTISSRPSSTSADASGDMLPVRQAFLLGWTLAETLGRLRSGARPYRRSPPGDDYAPRLNVSENEPGSSGRAFWSAVRRLLALAGALGLLQDKADQRDTWEQSLRALPLQIEQAEAQGDSQYTTPAALRETLDRWSLAAQAQLNGRSPHTGRALTSGASLADTCWYARPPRRPSGAELRRPRAERLKEAMALPRQRPSAEDWRRLLSYYRLHSECVRVNSLRSVLPVYVPDVLIRHLRAWAIGEMLYYDDRSQLRRRPWRQSPAFQMWLPRRMRRQYRSPTLLPEDEIALLQALKQQETRWRQMLFGLRRPEDFMRRRDLITVTLWRWLLLLLLLAGIGLAVGLLLYALGLIVAAAVWPAFQALMHGAGLGDWLKVITTGLGWLSVLGLLGKALFQWTRKAQSVINRWLMVRAIARRTLVPWNRVIRRKK